MPVKNLSLILNAVLLVAVAILYVLHFSSPAPAVTSTAPADTTVAYADAGVAAVGPQTVYVNTDTLLTRYEFFKKSKAALEARGRRLENDLAARGRTLESEYMSAQQRAQSGTLTQQEGAQLEQQLVKKQQDLVAYRDKVTQELVTEEQRLNEELNRNISNYLKDYGRDRRYTYVLGYSPGNGSVLYAADSLDITAQVLKGLNDRYADQSAQTK